LIWFEKEEYSENRRTTHDGKSRGSESCGWPLGRGVLAGEEEGYASGDELPAKTTVYHPLTIEKPGTYEQIKESCSEFSCPGLCGL